MGNVVSTRLKPTIPDSGLPPPDPTNVLTGRESLDPPAPRVPLFISTSLSLLKRTETPPRIVGLESGGRIPRCRKFCPYVYYEGGLLDGTEGPRIVRWCSVTVERSCTRKGTVWHPRTSRLDTDYIETTGSDMMSGVCIVYEPQPTCLLT